MTRVAAALACVMLACGARSELDAPDAAPKVDAAADHVMKDAPADVVHVDVVEEIAPPVCSVTTEDPSYGATEPIDACSEAQNSSAVQTNCQTINVAWEYIPAHDIDVTRLELDVIGGGVALYDSENDGTPGVKLFEGSFDSSGAQTWRGVAVSPPVHLAACHMYFIQQLTINGEYDPCSTAESGVAQRQFNPPGFMGPTWTGPYIWLSWAAHVIGTCP
jgi:hypothetical protein